MQVLVFLCIRSFLMNECNELLVKFVHFLLGLLLNVFLRGLRTLWWIFLGFHVPQQRAQPRPFEARALFSGSPLAHVSERIMDSVVDVPPCARVSGCAEQVEQARSS